MYEQLAIGKTIEIVSYSIVFSILLGLVLGLIMIAMVPKKSLWSCVSETVAISLVFGTLAIVTGFLTTTSREAAIADVVPAVLTLIGGLALYIVDKGYEKFFVTGVAVLSFSIMLFLGGALGSFERQRGENRIRSISTLQYNADVEFAINKYRKSLGLDPIKLNGAEK